MNNVERVFAHVKANPGAKREDIVVALDMSLKAASNALFNLKRARRLECSFAGRFSTWAVPVERVQVARPRVASVWELGAAA
jgi:hypothetical protein